MSHFDDIERTQIIMERERDGKKISIIANNHHCSTTAVRKILSRYYNTGEIAGGKSSGRPHSLSNVEKQQLDKIIRRKPTATATTLANEIFEKTGKRISARTIDRYRRELGYRPYHQRIKKSLTSTQEQTKTLFTQTYANDNIKRWLFSDEKIFTMNDVGTIAWCKPGEPRPTHAVDNIKAHAQLWGVVGWNFKAFSRYDGYMNSAIYHDLLSTHLGPHTPKLRRYKFYQDNISYHKSETILTWFKRNGIQRLDTPPYSPEFNGIEYVWSWIKSNVAAQQPKTTAQLNEAIDNACNAIPQKVIQSYISHALKEIQERANQ
jgi:transposase